MNKITYFLATIIVAFDNAIYRYFNIVTPLRKKMWRIKGKRIQKELDIVHYKVDRYNKLQGTDYCSSKVMKILAKNE